MKSNRKEARANLHKLVGEMYKTSPANAKKTIHIVYAKDYKKISLPELEDRLVLVGKILDVIDRNPKFKPLELEVMDNIEARFEHVRDDILERLIVEDDVVRVISDYPHEIEGLNHRLVKMIETFRRRVVIRDKMNDLIRKDIDFTEEDYRYIGREYDVPAEDARELVSMFKSCFDGDGRFLRHVFEKHIPVFAWYEKRIFELMWHFLKEIFRRNDRIAFLNSIQLLIDQMREPKKNAIKILLTDFLSDPYSVSFSDRNALMLSNLLVRKYNKELNMDIEVTPEEVLLVKEGVDRQITEALSEAIDTVYKERFAKKLSTISRRILESLNPGSGDSSPMPIRYLLSLERESLIFLCLIRGETALSVIRSALNTYGNPRSKIYHSKLSPDHVLLLFQQLKVTVRAIGRVGDGEDLAKLTNITNDEAIFRRLAKGNVSEDKVRQIMKWVDNTREDLIQKDMKDTREMVAFTVV